MDGIAQTIGRIFGGRTPAQHWRRLLGVGQRCHGDERQPNDNRQSEDGRRRSDLAASWQCDVSDRHVDVRLATGPHGGGRESGRATDQDSGYETVVNGA